MYGGNSPVKGKDFLVAKKTGQKARLEQTSNVD